MNEELVDVLLELRHYVVTDQNNWGHDSARQALADVAVKIDEYLTEHTNTKEK